VAALGYSPMAWLACVRHVIACVVGGSQSLTGCDLADETEYATDVFEIGADFITRTSGLRRW
jgi:hypothetical protein